MVVVHGATISVKTTSDSSGVVATIVDSGFILLNITFLVSIYTWTICKLYRNVDRLEGMQEEKREIKIQMCVVWSTVFAKLSLVLYQVIAAVYNNVKEKPTSPEGY